MNDPFEHMTSDDFMKALEPENWTETSLLHTQSYEFERTSNDVQIRDGMNEVHLSFDGALTLLQWLHTQKSGLTRLVNGLDTSEQEEIIRQLQHEQNERSITRSHFASDAAWDDWNVDHPQI